MSILHTLVMDPNPNPVKIDRKTMEKNRRNRMKELCSDLTSLVPHQPSREVASLSDQLEEAANYIKKLQINIKRMKEKRKCLMANSSTRNNNSNGLMITSSDSGTWPNCLPSIDVRVMGSTLEVILISEPTCRLVLSEIFRLLHEEGAEVVTASFSVLPNMVLHTIHCKISDECSQSFGGTRISERLRKYASL